MCCETECRGNGYNRNESTESFCKNDRFLLTEKCKDNQVCYIVVHILCSCEGLAPQCIVDLQEHV